MNKLLNKFNSDQSLKNAMALLKYIGKHPMAMLTASDNDSETISRARHVVWNSCPD